MGNKEGMQRALPVKYYLNGFYQYKFLNTARSEGRLYMNVLRKRFFDRLLAGSRLAHIYSSYKVYTTHKAERLAVRQN